MYDLIHLIYCSAETAHFGRDAFLDLFVQARRHNASAGITGMLLYSEGSFFQVLEGKPDAVDGLYEKIKADKRHERVTTIIREPIASRSFADWSMACADLTPEEAESIIGTKSFMDKNAFTEGLSKGRAEKLLNAFIHGRWRSRLSDIERQANEPGIPVAPGASSVDGAVEAAADALQKSAEYSFAFQPIIDIRTRGIFSYEALIRGLANESASEVLGRVDPSSRHAFDERSRVRSIELAAHFGLSSRLNINFLPMSLERSPTAISSLLEAAERCGLRPDQIVLEILESEIIKNTVLFRKEIDAYRGSGIIFAIDDFGAGYAGLNLLADFQPSILKLDMHLIRGVEGSGPRQAIIHGIIQTCYDLGVDVVAEGVETEEEFGWLSDQGISLFQGRLFADAAFERLPDTFRLPSREPGGHRFNPHPRAPK